jgi:NAD(P)H-dependent FMN reductase
MSLLILSCSLSPESRSRILANYSRDVVAELHSDTDVELVDLRDHELPLCDGATAYGAPAVAVLVEKIQAADAIIIATPIYNYDASAAVKNLVELTGRNWMDKVVAFLCAAGGQGSYMSIMALANSLMLDFRCLIIPRFVYVTKHVFDDNHQLVDEDAQQRIKDMVAETLKVGAAMKQ